MTDEAPGPAPLCATVPETCRLLRLSRAVVYRMLNDGRLRAVKCGTRTLVLMGSIEGFLATSPAYPVKEHPNRGEAGGGVQRGPPTASATRSRRALR